MLRHVIAIALGGVLLIGATSNAPAEVRFGVLAPRGEAVAYEAWTELGIYLTDQIGEPVTIVPLPPTQSLYMLGNRRLDFLLSNPVQSAIAQEVYKATPVASLAKRSGTQFAGVIVTRRDSGIVAAQQLRGKRVVSMRVGVAAGGYIFQAYYLEQRGIRVPGDLASLVEGKVQDDLVIDVIEGRADAAFVRTGVLEAMANAGRISLDDVTVVDERHEGFPLMHTTPLYPEWMAMAGPTVDQAVVDRVQAALYGLRAGDLAARAANINGFVEPVSLVEMKAALAALRIPPFDSLPQGPGTQSGSTGTDGPSS